MEKTTMNVQELAAQMRISLSKAYKLVKQPDFPVIHVGSRILIPVEAYKESNANKRNRHSGQSGKNPCWES